jgi:hypothetical protein
LGRPLIARFLFGVFLGKENQRNRTAATQKAQKTIRATIDHSSPSTLKR